MPPVFCLLTSNYCHLSLLEATFVFLSSKIGIRSIQTSQILVFIIIIASWSDIVNWPLPYSVTAYSYLTLYIINKLLFFLSCLWYHCVTSSLRPTVDHYDLTPIIKRNVFIYQFIEDKLITAYCYLTPNVIIYVFMHQIFDISVLDVHYDLLLSHCNHHNLNFYFLSSLLSNQT